MPVEKGTTITVNLGDRRLYRAMQHAAIDLDESMRVFVIKALQLRLETIEHGKKSQEEHDVSAMRPVAVNENHQTADEDQGCKEGTYSI